MTFKTLFMLASFTFLFFGLPADCFAEKVKVHIDKVLNNGPDGKRKVILVIGEGYAQADEEKYHRDVEEKVLQGALAHDVFKDNIKGFNVYRMDVWSNDSGVSHTKGASKNSIFDIQVKDEAVGGDGGGYFNFKNGIRTFGEDLFRAEALVGSKVDVAIVLLNDKCNGGATYGGHVIICGLAYDWRTMCHELGHALAQLWDEYGYENHPYKGEPINFLNLSTLPHRTMISWAGFLPLGVKIPTPMGFGIKAPTANGIGVFEGGNECDSGVFHPGFSCRMNNHLTSSFCLVCSDLFKTMLNQWLPNPKPLPYQDQISKDFNVQGLQGYSNFGFSLHKMDGISEFGLEKLKTLKGPFIQNCYYPVGTYAVESYQKDGKLKTAQFLSNPFGLRYFSEGKSSLKESVAEAKDGLAVFSLPYASKDEAIQKGLGIRIYKIKPKDIAGRDMVERSAFLTAVGPGGPGLFPVEPPVKLQGREPKKAHAEAKTNSSSAKTTKTKTLELARHSDKLSYPMTMTPKLLEQLKSEKRLELIADIEPAKLATMIKNFKEKQLEAKK